MKKSLLMTILGVLVGASACTEESEFDTPKNHFATQEVVITATHEFDSQTKTVLKEDGSVWWKPNDAIGVFFGAHCFPFYSCNMVDTPSASFVGNIQFIQGHNENSTGNVDVPSETYWGVFPPELANKYTKAKGFDYTLGNEDYELPSREGESLNVYLPSRQMGVAGTFDSNNFISIAKSDDYRELSFYNLCGGLAFCVEHDKIKTVTFSGNDGEILAGQVNVVMDSNGHPVVNEVINGKTEVTLAMKDGECFIPGEWYYIVMLPTTLEKGYTMTLNKTKKVSTDPVEIKRSVFGRLTNPDASVSTTEIYIDGDFADWDDTDPSVISVATNNNENRGGLKVMKVYADMDFINLYLEFDWDYVTDRSEYNGNPLDIYLSSDQEKGGYDRWTDLCVEYILEGFIFNGAEYMSWNGDMFMWTGGLHEAGWDWEPVLGGIEGEGAGTDDKYEFRLPVETLKQEMDYDLEFWIGVTISQNWDAVGVLPNAACTEDDPWGRAEMLHVTVY